MFRQSPRRNGRNKGLKIKHVLQISLLLGVSVWLLYQVHHSDDKKPPVSQDAIAKKLHNVVSKDMLRLGRKDLKPKVKEPIIENKKETDEHQVEEGGNETEPEDVFHDHEDHEEKHEEDREEITEHEQIKGHENKRIEDSGVKEKEKKESEEMKGNVKEGNKEKGDEKKMNLGQNLNLMPSVDMKIESVVNRKAEDLMKANGEEEKEKGESDEKEQEVNENESSDESEGKSEENGVLEEEKEALTDLGTLPESGIGGSRSTENTAAE